jgi:competence ComEA-like helix-hairpin-helix protein
MFDLTPQERQVVLFLVIVAMAGSGINFLAKVFAPVRSIACANPDIGKIDINTADKQTLKLIPGIGEKLAERILDYRRQNGKFYEPEDLKNVKGFHSRVLERARGQILIK